MLTCHYDLGRLQSEKNPVLRESKVIQNLKNENESLNLLNTRNQKEIDDNNK